MKTLIFTDSHGRAKDVSNLIDWAVKNEGIGKLVSLGDLDTSSVLRAFLQKATQHNLSYRLAIGNHDYHYVVLHRGTSSYEKAKHSESKVITDWDMSPKEKQFILDANEGKNSCAGLIVPDREVVYAHASLRNIPSEEVPEVTEIVWGYLFRSAAKREANFKEMARRDDFRLFFRGHDHQSAIFTQEGNFTRDYFGYWGKHKIDIENMRTIVNVGAFIDGEFALYDSTTKEVEFKNWNFEKKKRT
jgi:predicted phosphodiesterase